MRAVSLDEWDDADGTDIGECPFCGAFIVDLADEVSDGDCRDESEAVARSRCPSCGKTVAVVREHHYHLAKFKEETA